MRLRRRVAPAILTALVVAVAGCATTHVTTSPGPGGTGATPSEIAAAHLRPCPPSSATAVPGGLPNVTVPCLGDGPAVHMAGLTGAPTVVNVWGSWCPPCQAEEKYLSAAYDKDHARVRFLGVDVVDEADSALNFVSHVEPPVHFPSVFDENRKVALGLHVAAPPYTFFVSAAGRIVGRSAGAYSSTAQVQSDIARYLHVST
jgi:cytochrome c biogenesis protein CcmG, thiol:disulfide interchange protein DsbE